MKGDTIADTPLLFELAPGSAPIYRRIIDGVEAAYRSGQLLPGSRMPGERELASSIGAARGTVGKAYKELERLGFIEGKPGAGYYVKALPKGGKRAEALRLIISCLEGLRFLGYSIGDAGALVATVVADYETRMDAMAIALVDCNPETLAGYELSLASLGRLAMKSFLLDELLSLPDPARALLPFRLVITTATHYDQLVKATPAIREAIIRVSVAPARETVLELGALGSGARILLAARSQRFASIMRSQIAACRAPEPKAEAVGEAALAGVLERLGDYDVLIAPPGWPRPANEVEASCLAAFRERGGRVLSFRYELEKGSLLHIEERIAQAMAQALSPSSEGI